MIMYTDMLCDRVRGTPPPLVATVFTRVSLVMHMEPEGHAPLYRPCDRKLFCACARNSGNALGMHDAVRGPHLESHGFPGMRSVPLLTCAREAWRPLSSVTWNPV